jgi:hypothetical protein
MPTRRAAKSIDFDNRQGAAPRQSSELIPEVSSVGLVAAKSKGPDLIRPDPFELKKKSVPGNPI